MTNRLEDKVQRLVVNTDEQQNSQQQDILETTGQETQAKETIHIHYFPDAIVILKEEETQVVDSAPVVPQKISCKPAYAIGFLYLLLIVSTLAFQLYCMFNPPTATVTIIPQSQHVSLTGTLQLGRLISPITISQTAMIPTTGKGHQDAKSATGYITLYNGLFASQTIAQGTILTGLDGVEVITDQDTTIPAGNPPSYGQISVQAHTLLSGSRGNIPAYDINQRCCASAVLTKNMQPFTGGQNARNFSTVGSQDITRVSTSLKTIVAQSVNGAFQGQRQPDEKLFMLPCTPTVTSDHAIGQEAAQVHVTVSQTCSAVAYNSQDVVETATQLLAAQALRKPGADYSLIGQAHVHIIQATVPYASKVFLTFQAQGTWVYAVSPAAQQRIKQLIAGRTKAEALQIVASLPGVEQTSIRFTGFGNDTRVPKETNDIYFHSIVLSR